MRNMKESADPRCKKFWLIALTALGVVYGDIGTSPLYAMRECFHHAHNLALSSANILGVLSLILWSLIIVISVKYILFIMRADNRGEGGILALIALIAPHRQRRPYDRLRYLIPVGVFGAALLFGDGMITPAISVLSAIEGLEIWAPQMQEYVVPLTVVILVSLFVIQKYGTAKIGAVYGPIILLWFFVIGILGVKGILQELSVLAAVNPMHAVQFFIENGKTGFFVLGSVFLVVTGGEALYADMGHFGRKPIQYAWFLVALPGLVLNYFGQGALLIGNPEAIENPFYKLVPEWALLPMLVLSTAATVIASQALISGVFSLTRQAIQLGYIPRMRIVHTSREEIGQIYIPVINWGLLIAVVWLVLSFKSSSNLAAAYGLAVTATMVTTTLLAYFVARRHWGWSRWSAGSLVIFFLVIDVSFFAANLVKIPDGGWFPLMIGGAMYFLMATWQKGRSILADRMKRGAVPIAQFVNKVKLMRPIRVPGDSVFMTSDPDGAPAALIHNLKHNKVMHERVAILTVMTKDVPYIPAMDRVEVTPLEENIFKMVACYGFMQTPNIREIIEATVVKEFGFDFKNITFFLGRETILASEYPGMAIWREQVFVLMSRNAQRATAFFNIPPDQVIEVGIQVEI